MSKVQKQTHSAKVGSSAKSKGASLPTPLDYGGAGNAVQGQDERHRQAPWTAFPAPMLPVCLDNGRCRHTRDDNFAGGCCVNAKLKLHPPGQLLSITCELSAK